MIENIDMFFFSKFLPAVERFEPHTTKIALLLLLSELEKEKIF